MTSALLLSKDKSNKVTVVAKHMPGDYDIEYASPFAGANICPYVPAFRTSDHHQAFTKSYIAWQPRRTVGGNVGLGLS